VSDPMTHIAHTSRSTDSKDFYSTTGFWSTHRINYFGQQTQRTDNEIYGLYSVVNIGLQAL